MVVRTELTHKSTIRIANESLSLGSPKIQWGEFLCGDYSLPKTFNEVKRGIGVATICFAVSIQDYVHGANVTEERSVREVCRRVQLVELLHFGACPNIVFKFRTPTRPKKR